MSYQPTLKATPSMVVVDLEAGQTTGTTLVEYSKEPEQVIWHRWKPGDWQRVALQVSSPDDPALKHGDFTSPSLAPGEIYQVAIWEDAINPNTLGMPVTPTPTPIRALVAISAFALKKRPEQRSFLSDENYSTGGTYREHTVLTSKAVNAYMAVSTAQPQIDGNGFYSFPNSPQMAWAPLNQSFVLHITDLLPGTHYYELIRLTDEFGNWQFVQRTFITLKRRIRLQPTDLYITDDSDDMSNGEGRFAFTLETGDAAISSWSNRMSLEYANSNLETGKSVVPVPSGEIVVEPELVTVANRHIRVRVSGREDDKGSLFVQAEHFADGSKELFIPFGTMDEVVSDRPESVAADSGTEFKFNFSFKYSIDYL